MSKFHVGQRLTLVFCNDAAMTSRHEVEVKSVDQNPVRGGYQNRTIEYGTIVFRGKRKLYKFSVKADETFVLDGWDRLKVDTDYGAFRGNAMINCVGDASEIRAILDQSLVDVCDDTKANVLAWPEPTQTSSNGLSIHSPASDSSVQFVYPEIAPSRGHAVRDRLKQQLAMA